MSMQSFVALRIKKALGIFGLCRDYNAIRLRYDYDPTMTYRARLLTIRRKQKMNMSIFRRSRIVSRIAVESQL